MTKLHLRPVYEPSLQPGQIIEITGHRPQYPWDFDVFEEEAMNARDLRKKGIDLGSYLFIASIFGASALIMGLAIFGAVCIVYGAFGL